MAGTIPDMTRAVVARTGLHRTFVEQRCRILQDAGTLPVANGTARPAAKPRDLAALLVALANTDSNRHTPHHVAAYMALERIQPPFALPHDGPRTACEALTGLIYRIWSGDRAEVRSTITIVEDPQHEIIITNEQGHATHYYPPGSVVEARGVENCRRVLEISAKTIAAIGADLGNRRCAYAD